MDDRYIYLMLATPFFFMAMVIFVFRKDLRSIVVKTGLLGGVIGIMSEYWYFNDYWSPPTILERSYLPIEDFIFGFGVTAVGATIYKVLHKLQVKKTQPARKKQTLMLFGEGLLLLLIFNGILGINSILASSVIFILITLQMLFTRKDLSDQAIVTALILPGLAILVYAPLFRLFATGYIDSFFLLTNTALGLVIFSSIPLTEVVWYFSWGLLAGTIFDYFRGTATSKLALRNSEIHSPAP